MTITTGRIFLFKSYRFEAQAVSSATVFFIQPYYVCEILILYYQIVIRFFTSSFLLTSYLCSAIDHRMNYITNCKLLRNLRLKDFGVENSAIIIDETSFVCYSVYISCSLTVVAQTTSLTGEEMPSWTERCPFLSRAALIQ